MTHNTKYNEFFIQETEDYHLPNSLNESAIQELTYFLDSEAKLSSLISLKISQINGMNYKQKNEMADAFIYRRNTYDKLKYAFHEKYNVNFQNQFSGDIPRRDVPFSPHHKNDVNSFDYSTCDQIYALLTDSKYSISRMYCKDVPSINDLNDESIQFLNAVAKDLTTFMGNLKFQSFINFKGPPPPRNI